MWKRIHRNYLPILSGLIFLFLIGVVAVEIDRQVYQNTKKKICIENRERIAPDALIENLFTLADSYLMWVREARSLTGDRQQQLARAEQVRGALDEETSRIIHRDNPMVGISVVEIDQREGAELRRTVIRHEVDKQKTHNTFANCLVLRRFRGDTIVPIHSPRTKELLGELVITFTTPRGIEQIHNLTARYRVYLAGTLLAMGLLYWYILGHLIMPIKVVTERIDRSKGALPEVLAHPRTALESAYNDLAREALLNAITRTMSEYMSVDRLASRDEIVGEMPARIVSHFAFAAVYAVEMAVGEGIAAPIRWRCAAFHGDSDNKIARPTDADWIELGRQFDLDWDQAILEFSVGEGKRSRPHFAVPLAVDRQERHVVWLAATPRGPLGRENLRWNRETLLLLAGAIRKGLETLDMQRDLIAREKSKANISLSRNLGHDLTNVLATSKLELDTVRRILRLPPDQRMALDPQQREFFMQSLEGLLNNTKFLQELINIYRSFSYLNQPRCERVEPNALVQEVVDLFQLSLSRRVAIHRRFAGGVPAGYVEPRLLKLALFNLLSNATDALRRRAMREADFGAAIWVSTAWDAGSGEISISVRDNGYGILNARGEAAAPEEIRAIFQSGFTTKREGMAEGLGLSWVRQIVQGFHRGQLRARNCAEGGAEVSLVIPHYAQPPDLEGFGGPNAQPSAAELRQPPVAEVRNS